MSKYTVAVVCVFALGAGLRLTAFFHNRSLWLDEAMLAGSIVSRSYSELARPLAYYQRAPLGYLAAVKTFVLIEGANEYALRAMSLIAALIALGLFTAFSKTYFHGSDWLFACAVFAVSPISIYYAGEAKQYSQDLLVSVLLLYIVSRRERMGRFWGVAALGAAGAIGMWFSYAAVFVLGAIGALLAFEAIRDRNIGQSVATVALAITWLFSLAVFYRISVHDLSGHRVMLDYWRDQFVPTSLAEALRWGWGKYWALFVEPMGTQHGNAGYCSPGGYVIGLLFAVGLASLCVARKELAWIIAGPYLFALLAAAFRFYPFGGFGGRLLLFTLPLTVMGSAEGWRVLTLNHKWLVGPVLGCAILLPAIKNSEQEALGNVEEVRPLIVRMRDELQSGDRVYVSAGAGPAFAFYAHDLGYLSGKALHVTIENPEKPRDISENLRLGNANGSGRLWLLYSHPPRGSSGDEERLIAAARKYGKEVDVFQAPGASLHLFKFER
ncbi:MAG TPA: glycosyltransferase family 39 protein [Candidatus Udaeobacter sp.]|jgi:hypothetical protein